MRIPITMCHGISEGGDRPLTVDHLDRLMAIAAELGFRSVSYDDLAAWRDGTCDLPERAIMLDFDHPARSMRHGVMDVLARYGFSGNLFINTGVMTEKREDRVPEWWRDWEVMSWDEVGELADAGWQIGAHTVSHPGLSELSLTDTDGDVLRAELEECDRAIEENTGVKPLDFAFTGTSWSSIAEKVVMERYRCGRLWIIGSEYEADGKTIRFAELAGTDAGDEEDGGPPEETRYITEATSPYRLPSMEIQSPLMYRPEKFRAYLEGALQRR